MRRKGLLCLLLMFVLAGCRGGPKAGCNDSHDGIQWEQVMKIIAEK